MAVNLSLRIDGRNAPLKQIVEAPNACVPAQLLGQRPGPHEAEDLGLGFVRDGGCQDARAEGVPTAGVEVPERRQAVEPGVGDSLQERSPAGLSDRAQRGDLWRE